MTSNALLIVLGLLLPFFADQQILPRKFAAPSPAPAPSAASGSGPSASYMWGLLSQPSTSGGHLPADLLRETSFSILKATFPHYELLM